MSVYIKNIIINSAKISRDTKQLQQKKKVETYPLS